MFWPLVMLSACFPPFWSKKIWNVHQQRKLWQRCKMTKQATKSFFIAYFYIQKYCRLFTGMRDRKFQRVLKILLWYLRVNNFRWKGVVLTAFFCILFQPLIWILDSKRKKDKRTTGDKTTKTQEDAVEVIMIRDHKITNWVYSCLSRTILNL